MTLQPDPSKTTVESLLYASSSRVLFPDKRCSVALFVFSEVCGGEPRSTHFNTNDRGPTQFCLRYMLRDGHDFNTDEVEIYNNHTNAYRSLMTKRICVLERTGRKLS